MTRRVLALLTGLALLAGCSSAGHPQTSSDGHRRLTLLLDWTPNTNHSGIYLAQARGWYARAGLDVHIVEPGEGSNGGQMLATGKADFTISTEEELTPQVQQGLPVVSVAAIVAHNTSSLIASKASGITRPRDLAGKKYGGFGGSQLDKALLSKLIECDGGDPKALKYVQVGQADYRVGLTKRFYDYFWGYQGWEGVQLGDIDHLPITQIPFTRYQRCLPDWYTPLLATSQRLIDQDPDVVAKFVQATARGYRAAMADPAAAAAALLKAAPDLNHQLVRDSARFLAHRYADDPAQWGRQDKAVWSRMTTFLRQSGVIKGKVDVDRAFTNRFLGDSG